MTDSQHDGNWFALICGLPPPPAPVSLAPGVTLVPLRDSLTIFDLAAAGAVGFQGWSALEQFAPFCGCEIESAKDSELDSGYNTLNRAWLASALMVLRGFSRHAVVACNGYSWNRVAGHKNRNPGETRIEVQGVDDIRVAHDSVDLPQFSGTLLDLHFQPIRPSESRTDPLSESDVDWIRSQFDTADMLAADSSSFRFALEASSDWRHANGLRSAVARLWTGIESLFDVKFEIVFRISLYCASLLEPRGPYRTARFHEVKKLYGFRSKAVHGSPLSEEQLQKAVDGSFRLLSELLVATIEQGRPFRRDDFDRAVFE